MPPREWIIDCTSDVDSRLILSKAVCVDVHLHANVDGFYTTEENRSVLAKTVDMAHTI